MDRNLPIRLFQKRTRIDERAVEAGGNDELPKWAILTEEELNKRVQNIVSQLDEVSNVLNARKEENSFIPAVLSVKLDPRATAKSHRQDIFNVFDSNSGRNVIGVYNDDELLIKVHSSEETQVIKNSLDGNRDIHKKALACISGTELFTPQIHLPNEHTPAALRATLINYQDERLNIRVKKAFELECALRNIECRPLNYARDLIVYRLSGVSQDMLSTLEKFEALETLSIMPQYSIGLDSFEEVSDFSIPIKMPDPNKEYPVVGVLDSGISAIPHLKPWLTRKSFSKVPKNRRNENHGTAVASIIVYSDELMGSTSDNNNGCYIFDAAVMPDLNVDAIEEGDLVDHIEDAISQNHDWVKIWNLCLGSKIEADPINFSLFGKALDRLQKEFGVLICKSAGNCANFIRGLKPSRIANSADSILSLVIGSIAHEKNGYDIAEPFHPSPFSRIGRGPSHITKPELVHFGGNAGVDPGSGKMIPSGVLTFSANGTLVKRAGTSFATPRVTAITANLLSNLSDEFNPLLLKALTIHSAKYPTGEALSVSERHTHLGYGLPANSSEILFNDPYEITLVLQDSLPKGSWTQILDFPFPSQMVENGKYYGEITATLITMPLLAEGQGGEYCQSNLTVSFGTHDGVRDRTPQSGKRNTIRYLQSTSKPCNVLDGGRYSKPMRNSTSGIFSSERTLIEYKDKYHPIKKYAVNLDEMTETNAANALSTPKQWFLEIKGLFREHITANIPSAQLVQDYCLILTIRDPRRKHNIYDTVSRSLTTRGFVHQSINLRGEQRITI